MPKPFENLRERLLRAGVAPRHVRAYLTELREHLADLTEQECAAGGGAQEAARRAAAKLGDDETLAAAMLARPGVRSWTARAPWLVFTLAPLFSMAFIAIAWIVSFMVIGGTHGYFLHSRTVPWPAWFVLLGQLMSAAIDLFLMPGIALLFIWIARRQRLALLWPVLVTVLMLVIFMHMDTATGLMGQQGGFVLRWRWHGHFNAFELAWTTFLDPRAWRVIAAQWPLVLTQWTLTILPLAWFLKTSEAARVPD